MHRDVSVCCPSLSVETDCFSRWQAQLPWERSTGLLEVRKSRAKLCSFFCIRVCLFCLTFNSWAHFCLQPSPLFLCLLVALWTMSLFFLSLLSPHYCILQPFSKIKNWFPNWSQYTREEQVITLTRPSQFHYRLTLCELSLSLSLVNQGKAFPRFLSVSFPTFCLAFLSFVGGNKKRFS